MFTLYDLHNDLDSFYEGIEQFIQEKFHFSANEEIFNISPSELKYIQKCVGENDIKNLKVFFEKEIYQTKLQKKIQTLSDEIEGIDNDIEKNNLIMIFSDIIHQEYKNIKHWDDIFNYGDINDITVQNILQNTTEDFSDIIKKDITEYEKNVLNILFINIQLYCITYKVNIDEKIQVKNFLSTYQENFLSFIREKIA